MRRSIQFGLAAGLATTTALMTTVLAHHDDGKGGINIPSLDILGHEFANVVGAAANEESNAPRGHAPCIRGRAADSFDCRNIDMLSHLTLGDLGFTFVNDMWGWTDPVTGKDYALVGGGEGMAAVDISDPKRPDVVGFLNSRTSDAFFWRDIKVYGDHAFVVSEDTDHGMQILNLAKLRPITQGPAPLIEDFHYDDFGSAHNIAINEETGTAVVVGTDTCAGGLHIVDVSAPSNPEFGSCFEDHGYIHDSQCVVYSGPDSEHHGKEICINSAAEFSSFSAAGIFNTLSIVDVTDRANPVSIARTEEYPNDGYSHQGWLSPDQRYFFHNDELDEFFDGSNTSTRIFDLSDLDNPVLVAEVDHDTTSIGHNAYTEGRYLYASNYTAGLRIYDISNAGAGELTEVGFFDMYPENDDATFEGGTWSNYPYFAQKKIVGVSSMERGLFILQPRLGNRR